MFMQNSVFQNFGVQSSSLSLCFSSPPDYSSLLPHALSHSSFMDLSFIFFSLNAKIKSVENLRVPLDIRIFSVSFAPRKLLVGRKQRLW